jgi:hypothetical protein
MPGEADQRILLLAARHRDAVVDPHPRLEADKAIFALDQLEHGRPAIVIRPRLASAVVIDHQQRIARGDELAREAILQQLDVAIPLAAGGISLRVRAGVVLDVGRIAEGGEQRAVGGVLGEGGGWGQEGDGKRQNRGAIV